MRRYTPHNFTANNRSGMVALRETLPNWLASKARDPRQAHLEQLWRNWGMVMGDELAGTAHPLGHREGILLVGGEDHFLLQELSYATPEILERANAFMAEPFFQKVELHLLSGRTPLNQTRLIAPPALPRPERPANLGNLKLDPSTPVGRCYQAYLLFFATSDTSFTPTDRPT